MSDVEYETENNTTGKWQWQRKFSTHS